MKTPWWKKPEMVLAYGAIGAICSSFVEIYVYGLTLDWRLSLIGAESGFRSAYSGVSGVFLTAILLIYSGTFGATNGCLIVHLFGRYRPIAFIGCIVSGFVFSAVSAFMGFSLAKTYGWRMALALCGLTFLWSLAMIIFGVVKIQVTKKHIAKNKTGLD